MRQAGDGTRAMTPEISEHSFEELRTAPTAAAAGAERPRGLFALSASDANSAGGCFHGRKQGSPRPADAGTRRSRAEPGRPARDRQLRRCPRVRRRAADARLKDSFRLIVGCSETMREVLERFDFDNTIRKLVRVLSGTLCEDLDEFQLTFDAATSMGTPSPTRSRATPRACRSRRASRCSSIAR